MTEYTKVPALTGPVRDRARRLRDNESVSIPLSALSAGVVISVGVFSLAGVLPPPNGYGRPVLGSVGLLAVALIVGLLVWLWSAPGFYVKVEGSIYDYFSDDVTPASRLKAARTVWDQLPRSEKAEMRPVIEAAYAAALVGGDDAADAVKKRWAVLDEVHREVLRREEMERRAILTPTVSDLEVGKQVLRELRESNDATEESNDQLRKLWDELTRKSQ